MNKNVFSSLALAALLFSLAPSPLGALPVAPIGQVAQATAADIAHAGPLNLGMTEEQAVAIMGLSPSKSKPVLVPATGRFNKELAYPDQGVVLTLSAEQLDAPYTLESLTMKSPCAYVVAGGVMVGTLEREAYNRFKTVLTEDINSFDGTSNESFGLLVMSTYTVLSVHCAGGVVQEIYLGPGPE